MELTVVGDNAGGSEATRFEVNGHTGVVVCEVQEVAFYKVSVGVLWACGKVVVVLANRGVEYRSIGKKNYFLIRQTCMTVTFIYFI